MYSRGLLRLFRGEVRLQYSVPYQFYAGFKSCVSQPESIATLPLFRHNPVLTPLHLRSPVHVVPASEQGSHRAASTVQGVVVRNVSLTK